jgi:hypothetical protein
MKIDSVSQWFSVVLGVLRGENLALPGPDGYRAEGFPLLGLSLSPARDDVTIDDP